MIKKIQNFREATAPKVDVRVDGRDPGHLFEAEATRFFGGGARVRSRADRRRIRGPAAWRRRGTDARGEILVSSWFGEERARGPTPAKVLLVVISTIRACQRRGFSTAAVP